MAEAQAEVYIPLPSFNYFSLKHKDRFYKCTKCGDVYYLGPMWGNESPRIKPIDPCLGCGGTLRHHTLGVK